MSESRAPRAMFSKLLFDRRGTLTQDLLRVPGRYGLGQVPQRLEPDRTTTMTCGFCSTGCGLSIHLRDGAAVNLSPATDYPVNLGMACPKGWEALAPLASKDRATTPLLRRARGEALAPVDWATALDEFVRRFKQIQTEHGPESVAWLGTGQITVEELALLGAFAKFGMGMVHGDGNTRQCMATAVVAYKQSFGFDAPPYTYADFEASDVLIFVGANPCIAHPIMWERVCKNQLSPEIIVVDPRKTETAMAATQHLPLAPKSDLVLFYTVANLLIERGHIDREFIARSVSGFDELAAFVAPYTLERAVEATRLEASAIERLVQAIARGKAVSLWWTMGVNQSYEGVRLAQALINIALITGNIGRPGTGANSITGQCNAMGSRLFSNTTGLLGGRDFTNPAHRAEVAQLLDIDEARIPRQNSWAYDQIMEGILEGKIKGLWVVATNTAHSWINQADAYDVLKKLDFLVVQDMYHTTETAQLADLMLPAAGWGEKEGLFINSERRLGLIKKVARAPGQALADFSIIKLLADAWGVGDMFEAWSSPEAAFQILKRASAGRPCDISGIEDYGHIDAMRGIQWPLPAGQAARPGEERRLFEDGKFYHADGKAKLLFEEPRKQPESTDDKYPLLLLTGRGSSSQWHTGTRTNKSAVLRKLFSESPYVEVSPSDARALDIEQNEWVVVESRRGNALARAFISHVVQPGQCFMPMHYAKTNQLTFAAFDPYSRQPSYKNCAVRIRRRSDVPSLG
ncbi:MAG TPA: nitrate reductase [Polyangiaceae bacterium]|nr:nitrate reductase [Polyangiaceae bacterium]